MLDVIATQPDTLILASTSRYRSRLLARLQLPFECVDPGVDEAISDTETGCEAAERLAVAKARSVDSESAVVIGSDQVAVCENRILGKPLTPERAEQQLRLCSGREVNFYTAIALWRPEYSRLLTHVEPYRVQLRTLTDREVQDYVAWDNPVDCAGSFKWEALGITLFDAMYGEDPTALEGLPLIALSRLLRTQGFALPPRPQAAEN